MSENTKPLESPKYPPFLQKLKWILNPIGYMESAAKKLPDLFFAQIIGFGDNLVFVSDPQAIQKIFTNDRKTFTAPGNLNKTLMPLVGSNSIFLLEGDRHQRERKLLMPPFHGERMEVYGDIISKLTEKVINELPLSKPFLARSAIQEISLEVILQIVFGLYKGERCQKLKHLLSDISKIFSSPLTSALLYSPFLQKDLGSWSPWGNFLRKQKQIDELLYEEICERREERIKDRNDILSLLMSARDEDGNTMTNKELRDELITLLFAGNDTTATAMAWSLYWIHHLPDIKQKLIEELDNLGNDRDPMKIFRLPYLTAVCNETLRIYPVALITFPRVVQKPVKLIGYELKPGKAVVGCIYITHHRDELYPEPKKFKPERFLERKFSPYEFMPFGAGARRCIGYALAMFEMKLVLAHILSNYELKLVRRTPEKPERRGVTIAPGNGVKMIITKKRIR